MSHSESLLLKDQPKLESTNTKQRFASQVVVVNGGVGAIGSAVVCRFLQDGAVVAVLDINLERKDDLIKDLKETIAEDPNVEDRVSFHRVDTSKRADCFTTVDGVVQKWGKINHLVNAAAHFAWGNFSLTEELWHETMDVNVSGYCFMAQACYKEMVKISKTENCAIVNFSSAASHTVHPRRWAYSASKAAVDSMTRCMALDMGPAGIRVNSVLPGWVWTRITASFMADKGGRAAFADFIAERHLTCKWQEVAEIAGAVCFLCSRDAAAISGAEIPTDGGYTVICGEQKGGVLFKDIPE